MNRDGFGVYPGMNRRLVIASLALAACTSDDGTTMEPPPTDGFQVTGSINIANAPAGSRVVVVWEVTSGVDALIKFGDVTPTGNAFTLGLDSDPPPRAINSYGVAVGTAILVDASVVLPQDGADFEFDAVETHVLGFSDFKNVIWRGPGIGEPPAWAPAFPQGYSCGRCVLAPESESHDSFAPTACTGISITTQQNICNWT